MSRKVMRQKYHIIRYIIKMWGYYIDRNNQTMKKEA